MTCPVCKSLEHAETALHSDGFNENIMECRICGTTWSINHGIMEVIKDSQESSFLESISECVEGDDYNLSRK